MHELEPFYGWRNIYKAEEDESSPFFGVEHSEFEFTDKIYNHVIHPQWDSLGSESLYTKVLFADELQGVLILEFIGEWNDALHNDIMHLVRNLIDHYVYNDFRKFILIGENVFNFHGSDDEYYADWFENIEDGWITGVGFQEHVWREMSDYGVDQYINFGGELDHYNWRSLTPNMFVRKIEELIENRLGA